MIFRDKVRLSGVTRTVREALFVFPIPQIRHITETVLSLFITRKRDVFVLFSKHLAAPKELTHPVLVALISASECMNKRIPENVFVSTLFHRLHSVQPFLFPVKNVNLNFETSRGQSMFCFLKV